jgi:adiponectin receptor
MSNTNAKLAKIGYDEDIYVTYDLYTVRSVKEWAYLADELILNHYSIQNNFINALKASAISLHNETVNIWIHALSCVYFLYETTTGLRISYTLGMFCVAASICYGCSAISHLVMGLGKERHDSFSKIDYAGISILVWGSIIPLNDIVFWHESMNHLYYLSFLVASVACGATLIFCFVPRLSNNKIARVAGYVCATSSALIPLYQGTTNPNVSDYLNHTMPKLMLVYSVAITLYISRFPEKKFPGTFDRVFSSHNFWHLLVFLGSVLHYESLKRIMLNDDILQRKCVV